MLGFFRTTEVLAFAASVVDEYDRLQRSTAMRHDTPGKRRQKFERLSAKIDDYSREHRLNFYKKSKMLYAVEQGLAEKGVAAADIQALLGNLLAKGLKRR